MASLGRLTKRGEFQRVYSRGEKAVGRFLVVFGLAAEVDLVRIGITATRKLGGAVVRNRCRRRVRELFRRHSAEFRGLACDLVVNVRGGCAEANWSALEEDFLLCLQRLSAGAGRRRSR